MNKKRMMLAACVGMAVIGISSRASAATFTWNDGSVLQPNNNSPANPWTDPTQWTPNGTPNFPDLGVGYDDLVFDVSTVTTVNMRPDIAAPGGVEDQVGALTFTANAPNYTFTSSGVIHDIDLYGPMTNSSNKIQTFGTGIALNGALCVVNATTGDIGSNYSFEASHLWVGGGSTYNGPFDMHVTGVGASALQALGNFTLNNAKIIVEGGTTTTGTYNLGGNGTVILNGAWNPSSSTTSVTKAGTGTLVLNGASPGTARPMIISAGILRAGNSTALGANTTRVVTISGGSTGTGTLQVYNGIALNKNVTLNSRTAGSAPLVAIQNFSGNNSMTGNITMTTGGGYYNFGSINAGEKLTFTGTNVVSSAAGTRIITTRGAGDLDFSPTNMGHNLSTSSSNVPLYHYGTGTVTLNSHNTYRLGHVIAYNGGTVKLGSNFASTDSNPTGYPLFAAVDDHVTPNPTQLQLLNNSTIDVSAASALYVPTTMSVGMNRTVAGTGTVIGSMMTVPTDSANTSNPYRNSDAAGMAFFKPGNGVNIDPADPNGIDLVVNDTGAGNSTFKAGIGTLLIQGDLDMLTGGSVDGLEWHLGSFLDQNTGVAGTDWDLLQVSGDVKLDSLDAVTLGSFTAGSASGPDAVTPDIFWNSDHSWKILDAGTNSTGASLPGFAIGTVTHYDPAGPFVGGDFTLSLGSGVDNGDLFVNWTATPVPEPSTYLMAAVGLISMSGYRLRRGRKQI